MIRQGSMFDLLLVLCFVISTVLSCSCPEDAFRKNRLLNLWDSYIEKANENVYSGVVTGGSCKCVSDNPFSISCVDLYESNETYIAEEDKTFNCGRFSRVFFEFDDCKKVYSKAFGYQSYDIISSGLEVVDSTKERNCGFRRTQQASVGQGQMGCTRSYQPCSYEIQVKEVFKGKFSVGDIVVSDGPDVTTSCGFKGRILEIGETYMVGIGAPCTRIRPWSKKSLFATHELQLLRVLKYFVKK